MSNNNNNLNGYAEINIGGKIRPFKASTYAYRIFAELKGYDIFDIPIEKRNYRTDEVLDLIYAFARGGARYKSIPVDFDQYDIDDWIDQLSSEPEKLAKFYEEIIALGKGAAQKTTGSKGKRKRKPTGA